MFKNENFRRFQLERLVDISGVSGTGIVAVGVLFPTGRVVMQWLGPTGSIIVHESMDNLMAVHGHGGATRVIWIDEEAGDAVEDRSSAG